MVAGRGELKRLGDVQADDRPLLLVSTLEHVLQIFTIPPTRLPEDQHVRERFGAPEEIISIPTLKYSNSTGRAKAKSGVEKVVSAKLIGRVPADGPSVLLLIADPGKGMSSCSLAMLSLWTGEVVKWVDIGNGQEAALSVSSRAVVVVSLWLTMQYELTIRQCRILHLPSYSSTPPP
jgi:hypothetical protein